MSEYDWGNIPGSPYYDEREDFEPEGVETVLELPINLVGVNIKKISVERTSYKSDNFATVKIVLNNDTAFTIDLDIPSAEELAVKAYDALFDISEQPTYLKEKIYQLEKQIDKERGWKEIC